MQFSTSVLSLPSVGSYCQHQTVYFLPIMYFYLTVRPIEKFISGCGLFSLIHLFPQRRRFWWRGIVMMMASPTLMIIRTASLMMMMMMMMVYHDCRQPLDHSADGGQ